MISMMGLIAGCCLIYLGALWATYEALVCVANWNEQRKWERCARYISNELSSMARWCAHEFPIIDDITKEVITNLNEGGRVCNNSNFRDRLRSKYLPTKKAADE